MTQTRYAELMTNDLDEHYEVYNGTIVLQLTEEQMALVRAGQFPLSALDLVRCGTVTRTFTVYRTKELDAVFEDAKPMLHPRDDRQPD